MLGFRATQQSLFYLLLKFISSWSSSVLIPIIALVHQEVKIDEPLVCFGVVFELFLACDAVFGYYCEKSVPADFQTEQSSTSVSKVVIKPSCVDSQSKSLLFDMSANVVGLLLLTAMFSDRIPLILLLLPWILKTSRMHRQYTAMVALIQTRRLVNPLSEPMLRMIFLAVFGCWLLSFFSCVWFFAGCGFSAAIGSGNDCHGSWVAVDTFLNLDSGISRYLRSLHFVAQTFFSIGFGDIFPVTDLEFFITLLALIMSSIFFGSLVSSMASLIANRDVVLNKFRVELYKLNVCLDVCCVSEFFSSHTKNFFSVLFTRQNGLLETKFFSTDMGLPHRLRSMHMNRFQSMLRQIPYFKLSPERVVSDFYLFV